MSEAGEPALTPLLDDTAFRAALGRYPTGVTIVSCVAAGADHAMTANSFTSVSLDPPLVLVCVELGTRFHEAISETSRWGVSILAASARGAATWLATPGRPLAGQLDPVAHHRGPLTGVALVDASLATLECRTAARHTAGDHEIVVGEVLGIGLPDSPGAALTYFRRQYGSLP